MTEHDDSPPLSIPRHPWYLAGPEGDPQAWADVLSTARSLRRRYAGASNQLPEHTQSLIGRAAAKLANARNALSETHATRLWVRAMKQVLIDVMRGRDAMELNGDSLLDTVAFERASDQALTIDEALAGLFRMERSGARFRVIIVLRFVHEWETLAVAELLGVSQSKVYEDLAFIRATLRTAMRMT